MESPVKLKPAAAPLPRVRRSSALWLAAALVPGGGRAAAAAELDWSAADGNWSNSSNWLQGVVPATGDDAFIINSDATSRAVAGDFGTVALSLNSLWLDNAGGGTTTFTQAGGSLTAPLEMIGYNGRAAYVQNGGSNFLNGYGSNRLFLGYNTGSAGVYTLNGGTLGILGAESIGFAGNGCLVQHGGANAAGILFLASGHESQGTYTLTGGTATVSVGAWVGGTDLDAGGTGVVNISGGLMSIAGPLKVWDNPGNVIHLSGGTLSAATLDLGTTPSHLDWTGGTLSLTGSSLTIGSGGLLGPSLTLAGSKSLGVSGTTTISAGGMLTLNGGTFSTGSLVLTAGTSSLQWNTGTLNLTNAGLTIGSGGLFGPSISLAAGQSLGVAGTTTFNAGSSLTLNGGTFTAGPLALANWSQLVLNTGALNLTGSAIAAGTLTAGSAAGAVSVSQTAGSYRADYLRLAAATGSTGNYTLGSGTLTVVNDAIVGVSGNGSFTQTGGAHTINGSNGLSLAASPGAAGAYTIGGGLLTVPNLYVGGSPTAVGGTGTLGITGGTVNVLNALKVWPGGSSVVHLSGGTLNVGSLDFSGVPAAFDWTGGTLNLTTGNLTVGAGGLLGSPLDITAGKGLGVAGSTTINAGSTIAIDGGNYFAIGALFLNDWTQFAFNSGTVTLARGIGAYGDTGPLYVGTSGPAAFNQFGGDNAVGTLYVGRGVSSTYTLGAGNLAVAHDVYVGQLGGAGTFKQTVGVQTVGGTIYVGDTGTTTGTYGLTGGSLRAAGVTLNDNAAFTVSNGASLNVTGTLRVAGNSATDFNLYGGATVTAGLLDLTDWSRLNFSGGTLNLTNGSTASTNSGTLLVGTAAPAALNQGGGAIAAGALQVGYSSAGSYSLTAGASLTLVGNEYVGHQVGSSTFTQTGGMHAIGGSLFVGTSTKSQPAPMPTGANLDGTIYYGVAHTYADAFNLFETPANATYDANGNLAGAWTSLSFLDSYPSGVYKLSYTATGTNGLAIAGMGQVVPGTLHVNGNTVTADVQVTHTNPDNTGGTIFMFATNVANVHLLAPGYTSGAQVFTTDFSRRAAPFTDLRMMDWGGVNFSTVTSWTQRATVNAPQTGPQGTAYENQIALANQTRKDIWVNIPLGADDDYIRHMADLFHTGLTSGATIHVELSNEVWNFGFPQAGQNYNAALVNPTLTATDTNVRAAQNYAQRAAQASAIWQSSFGSSKSQVDFVLGGKIGDTTWADQGLQFVKATMGDPKGYFGAVAVGPYFANDAATIGAIGANPDGIFNAIFNEINTTLFQRMKDAATESNQYGLKLYAYEGGDSLPSSISGITGLTQQQGAALLAQLQNDPRMYQALQQMFANWNAAGGALFNNFSHIGQFWGLLTDPTLPGSQKWDATLARMLYAGDATIDNKVNYDDVAVVRSNFGKTGQFWEQGDFNHDGTVDLGDVLLMQPNLRGLTLAQAADYARFVGQQVRASTAGDRFSLSGTGTLSVAGDEFIGNQGGLAAFNQSGGTHTVGGRLVVGNGIGSLSLSGGTLYVAGSESIGYGGGLGVVSHTGGTHTVGGGITLGDGDGSIGYYALDNSAVLDIFGDVLLGSGGGTGIFDQSDGAHVVTGTVYVGLTGQGQYNLNGGTLSAGGGVIVGNAAGGGTGIFQIGGPATYGGSITVNRGGTLGGAGAVGGSVAVNSGGAVSPGGSPTDASQTGGLSTGAQTWSGGGTYVWKINNPAGSAGSANGWDLLTFTSLSILADSTTKFTIKVIGAESALPAPAGSSYAFRIAQATGPGGITGFDASKFTLDASGFQPTTGAGPHGSWSIGLESGNSSALDLSFDFTAAGVTPEPAGALALLGSFVAMGLRPRRREHAAGAPAYQPDLPFGPDSGKTTTAVA